MSTPEGPGGWPPMDPSPPPGPQPQGFPPPGYPPQGYPPPGYPPPGYGGYPYGYGVYPISNDHPQGTIILILGICGIVLCQILGPVAWVMGNKTLAEIDAQPGVYTNRSMVNGGRICGIVGTALLAVNVVIFFLWFAILGGIAASGA